MAAECSREVTHNATSSFYADSGRDVAHMTWLRTCAIYKLVAQGTPPISALCSQEMAAALWLLGFGAYITGSEKIQPEMTPEKNVWELHDPP